MDRELRVIGWVRSPLLERGAGPRMEDEGAPAARIEIEPFYREAADGLEPGQEIHVLTWLHLADRSFLNVHPRGDVTRPLQGVFSTRSPDRPNPLGMHTVRITAVEDGLVLHVDALEAVDGTPVVDIKPCRHADDPAAHSAGEDWGEGVPAPAAQLMQESCARAWRAGLAPGASGNASLRLGNLMLITTSGSVLGDLRPGDLTALEMATGKRLGKGRPSSETPMHLEVYDAQPQAWALLHTHPPHLTAASLLFPDDRLLDLPLYEAEHQRKTFTTVEPLTPGTPVLAKAVARAARDHQAVFLRNHGLLCWGESLAQALALSEALDALARIQLLSQEPGGARTALRLPGPVSET